jgi:hypothetical protein
MIITETSNVDRNKIPGHSFDVDLSYRSVSSSWLVLGVN